MTSKPLVVYHKNCMDGFGAAWAFWRKYEGRADYLAAQYGDPPPNVNGRDVYLVDISYGREEVAHMLVAAQSVTLIDHHKTAMDTLADLVPQGLNWYCRLDRSGAVLAWQYLFPHESCPRLLRAIEDRDLWKFEHEHTRPLMASLASHDYDFKVWDRLVKECELERERARMVMEGEAIERKFRKDLAELLPVVRRRMMIGGFSVPVASLPYTMASEAANALAVGERFAACYWDTERERAFSLRSDKSGMDVSLIAKMYGGGGHKHAAGFKVPRTHELASM